MDIQADVEPTSWTVMIKASRASQDGWYWANYGVAPQPPVAEWQKGNPPIFDRSAITSSDFYLNNRGSVPPTKPNPDWYPTGYVFEDPKKLPDIVSPFNQYGNYCLNCHASAEKEATFTSLENVLGPGLRFKQFPPQGGHPLQTPSLADLGLENVPHGPPTAALLHLNKTSSEAAAYQSPFPPPLSQPTQNFLNFYNQLAHVPFAQAWQGRLPAETYDHLVPSGSGPPQFLTSDQCISCHDATFSNAAVPNMIFKDPGTGSSLNLSPYSEWRASPMGLAGRDPIFFSQLQGETNNLPALTTCMENTCLHCHGVMGQRQLAIDTAGQDTKGCEKLFAITPPPEVPFGTPFVRAIVSQWPGARTHAQQQYGALARDGISCTVCHHIEATDLGQERSFTGNFVTGPADELYGPYKNNTIVPKPMEHAIGSTPLVADQITGSDLCGSCHNILLPVLDTAGNPRKPMGASYEQTTHLEWVNSDFAPGRANFRSCQDCHMPTQFRGTHLAFKIANIESNAFAPVTNRLPNDAITLTERDRYPRHSLHGLNVFLNEMFEQFPLILGARQIDYMTGTATVPSLITGRNSMLDMAKSDTAAVDIQVLEKTAGGKLRAVVLVTNKTGHYLPSGVGFRRVFLEFLVRDKAGTLLWASGRTNTLGAILNGTTDQMLPSEQPVKFPGAPFQPHYQIIERGDQVQIYQELVKDSEGNLTTSFVQRFKEVKDNRIRPKGFDPAVFAKSPSPFIRELAELHGREQFDPYYVNPQLTGADQTEYLIPLDAKTLARVAEVQVSLYSQSIPPFYLQERFRDANRGPGKKDDIQRLYHITSHLDVNAVTDDQGQRVLQSWKLLIAKPQTRRVQSR
jgi:hypothetical protein